MGYPTKIATCCFCGSKAALKLDKGRHELSCASCGAPLRDLKMLPKEPPKRASVSHATALRHVPQAAKADRKRKGKKVRKYPKGQKPMRWFKDMAEEVFDFVEDIFD